MVTYTTKVLIPLKLVLKKVMAFYRLPVLVPYSWNPVKKTRNWVVRDEIVLEDKLEEARLHSVKRRKQITIGLFAAICLCGFAVIGLSYFDFSTNKNVQVVASSEEKQSENERIVASDEEKQPEDEQVVVFN